MKKETKNILSAEINSIKDLNKLNESFNEIEAMINERKAYLTMISEAAKLSEKNFGYIKEAFEELSPVLYKTTKGKNILKKYINEIKSNKALSQMYSIYENVCHAPKEANESYMVQSFSNGAVSKKAYKEGTAKVGNLLAEAYIAVNGKCDLANISVNTELNEAIDALATSKRSLKNMAEDTIKVKKVEDYICENKGSKTRQKATKNENIERILEDFNTKYSDSEFANLIKEVSNDNGTLFEEYKTKCLDAIKTTLDNNPNHIDLDRLNAIYEAISKKSFVKETVTKDIANFIELTEMVLD